MSKSQPEASSAEAAATAVATITTARVDGAHGPITIQDITYPPGDHTGYMLIAKGNRRYVKIQPGGEKIPRYYSVEVPAGSSVRHFQIHAGKEQVVAIAYYSSYEEETTCIRCGRTIVCGVNPSCGDSPPNS